MAKPKLALIPSTVGGSVYSVLPSNGDGDFDFSRASAATRINAQGLIETVAVGDNRLNYPLLDGRVQTCPHLLLEPQRTNLFTYSEDFTNAYWSNTRIETPYIADVISPTGELNAYTLEISSGEVNGGGVYKALSITGDNSWSVFAKKKTANYLVLGDTGLDGSRSAVYFNLSNGTIGSEYQNATGEMQDFGNGWYRCTMKYNLTSSGNKFIYLSNADGTISGGVQGGDSIYIYAAQFEQGSYPTSYIVSNSGSATTRLAEVCNGSGNASTFNDSEGVLFAQIGALANDGNRYIALTNGVANSYTIRILYQNETGYVFFQKYVNGVRTTNLSTSIITPNNSNKIAIRYNSTSIDVWLNGLSILTNSDTNVIPLNTLNVLAFDNGSLPFYGKTKQLQYFDSALTDSELETLTSWMSFSDMAIDLNYTIQ